MKQSSARPDDLDKFASNSREKDDDLRSAHRKLMADYRAFQGANHWGTLKAYSLLSAFDRYIDGNGFTARWVAKIAATFRAAGGSGRIVRLPDRAIKASLRAAGLDHDRQSVTFDAPLAYGSPPTTGYTNDPVNTATGNFVEIERDLACGGLVAGVSFERTYNSRSDRVGPFGHGWSSWATARLVPRPEGAAYVGPDGQETLFPRSGQGYGRIAEVGALVEPLESGLALNWFGGGGRWEFDEAGRPVRVSRGPGTEVTFDHDAGGRLIELTHVGGKHVRVQWNADAERVTGLECSDGRRVSYRYDARDDLVEVDSARGTRSYELDVDGRVVSVTDADGVVELVNTYDDEGRVREQLSAFGRRTHLSYLPGRVTVTMDDDEDGPVNTYVHDGAGRLLAIVDGEDQQLSIGYDEWGNPSSVTERNGAVTFQEWDERARPVRRVLPTGAELTYAWDEVDRLVEVAASNAAVTRYGYTGDERIPSEITDPEGGVTRQMVERGLVRRTVDPDGVTMTFEFDRDGNLIAATDGEGNCNELERDAADAVTAAITPTGRRSAFFYDQRGLLVERHDPAGGAWRFEYTAAGRLTALTDRVGAREEIRYGDHGEATATVDPLGHVTTSDYDIFGNVVLAVEPDGAAWRYTYDALMRPTTAIDPTGARWEREYDVNSTLVATVDPAGVRVTATVDAYGRVVAIDDGLISERYEYDEFGQLVAQHHADGTAVRAEYDLCGRRTSVTDATGATTRLEYTPGGRLARTIYPSARVDTLSYDACGRIAARVDGAGRRWSFRYDRDGALVEVELPSGDIERYDYDDAGRLATLTSPGEGVTSCTYDAAGRAVGIADRHAGERRFAYDSAGNLVESTDGNLEVTRYSYSERGWLVEVVDPLGGVVSSRYDAAGRVIELSDQLGRRSTLAYDPAGRVLEQVDGSGRTVRRDYDVSGRLKSFGAAEQPPVTVEYDAVGRVIAVTEPGAARNTLSWDKEGRLVERRRGDLAVRWEYDADGRRVAIGYPDGTATTYTHDAGGYVVGADHPTLGSIALERDAAGRLTAARAAGLRAVWRYDRGDLTEYEMEAGGRLRTAHLTRDPIGRIVEATIDGGQHAYGYDAAGQLTSASTPAGAYAFDYDANGRLARETSTSGVAGYEYDSAAQLCTRVLADGPAVRYEYDGAGRRVLEAGAGVTRAYRWDELGRLAEVVDSRDGEADRPVRIVVDALGELAELDGVPLLWDSANPLQPLAWNGQSAVVGEGGPWALAGQDGAQWLAPDWQGTIGDTSRDPWGAPLTSIRGRSGFGLGFRGEVEFGVDTWLRHRVYQPGSRSFLQRDPLAPVPGTAVAANPYHYAANNAVALSDPLGLRPVTDQELKTIRDGMDRGFVDEVVDHSGQISLVLSVAAVAFPPAGLALGLGALAFGTVAAGKSLSEGDYVGAGLDVAGAVPGVGAVRATISAKQAVKAAAQLDRRAATALGNAYRTQNVKGLAPFARAERARAAELTRRSRQQLARRTELDALRARADSSGINLGAYGVVRGWDRDIREDGGVNVPFRDAPLHVPRPIFGR